MNELNIEKDTSLNRYDPAYQWQDSMEISPIEDSHQQQEYQDLASVKFEQGQISGQSHDHRIESIGQRGMKGQNGQVLWGIGQNEVPYKSETIDSQVQNHPNLYFKHHMETETLGGHHTYQEFFNNPHPPESSHPEYMTNIRLDDNSMFHHVNARGHGARYAGIPGVGLEDQDENQRKFPVHRSQTSYPSYPMSIHHPPNHNQQIGGQFTDWRNAKTWAEGRERMEMEYGGMCDQFINSMQKTSVRGTVPSHQKRPRAMQNDLVFSGIQKIQDLHEPRVNEFWGMPSAKLKIPHNVSNCYPVLGSSSSMNQNHPAASVSITVEEAHEMLMRKPISGYVDTLELINRFEIWRKGSDVTQSSFAKNILGRTQGTLCSILHNPKSWDKLSSGKDLYIKIFNWMTFSESVKAEIMKLDLQDKKNTEKVKSTPKPKLTRILFTKEQKEYLKQSFISNSRPSKEETNAIANKLKLPYKTIYNYFLNHRRRGIMNDGNLAGFYYF